MEYHASFTKQSLSSTLEKSLAVTTTLDAFGACLSSYLYQCLTTPKGPVSRQPLDITDYHDFGQHSVSTNPLRLRKASVSREPHCNLPDPRSNDESDRTRPPPVEQYSQSTPLWEDRILPAIRKSCINALKTYSILFKKQSFKRTI